MTTRKEFLFNLFFSFIESVTGGRGGGRERGRCNAGRGEARLIFKVDDATFDTVVRESNSFADTLMDSQ